MTTIQVEPQALASWPLLLARIALTFPFWESAVDKLLHFQGAVAEMTHFGLQPPTLVAIAVIVVQLLGSILIIARLYPWLGAGALIVFTTLTIPIVHHFWNLQGIERLDALHMATEHVGLIGALILSAMNATTARGAPARYEAAAAARLR